jgi:GTP-binding protein Era
MSETTPHTADLPDAANPADGTDLPQPDMLQGTDVPQEADVPDEADLPDDVRVHVQAPVTRPGYKSGFVTIVGRPNVGKSTLINALMGQHLLVSSDRPETTRHVVRAVLTRDRGQIVLVDTPGIHRPRTLLGQRLDDMVDDALSQIDAILFLLPADQQIGPGDRRILERLRDQFGVRHEGKSGKGTGADTADKASDDAAAQAYSASTENRQGGKQQSRRLQGENPQEDKPRDEWKVPVIAVLTKIDKVRPDQLAARLLELDQLAGFTQIVPVSSAEKDNISELEDVLYDAMPEGPQMYPDDMLADQSPEEAIAEQIRGAFLRELDDELPHSLAVRVDDILPPDKTEGPDGKYTVAATIFVERSSQKPIILGHRASRLVRVKKRVRTAVNRIVGHKCRLDLHVSVAKDWQEDPKKLERLGF